jgi:hypothetical protein
MKKKKKKKKLQGKVFEGLLWSEFLSPFWHFMSKT